MRHGVFYEAAHKRVRQQRGKPSLCEDCGTTDPSKRYEWASISENYSDINDYKRLCRLCHVKFDDIGARISAAVLLKKERGVPHLDAEPRERKLTTRGVQLAAEQWRWLDELADRSYSRSASMELRRLVAAAMSEDARDRAAEAA